LIFQELQKFLDAVKSIRLNSKQLEQNYVVQGILHIRKTKNKRQPKQQTKHFYPPLDWQACVGLVWW